MFALDALGHSAPFPIYADRFGAPFGEVRFANIARKGCLVVHAAEDGVKVPQGQVAMKAELVGVSVAFLETVLAFEPERSRIVAPVRVRSTPVERGDAGVLRGLLRDVAHVQVHLVGDTLCLEHIVKDAFTQALSESVDRPLPRRSLVFAQ